MSGQDKQGLFSRGTEWLMISDAGPSVMVTVALIFGGWTPILVGHYFQGRPFEFADGPIFAFPFILFFVSLFLKQRNPMKWWSIFTGTIITVDTKKLLEREMANGADFVTAEIQQWVQTCSKSGYVKINPYRYKFRRKRDAVMFKLVWG